MGWIDYWCNAFTPDRSPLWDASLAEQGTPLVLRSDPLDSFAVPEVMAKRMAERGVDTLVLPTCDLPLNAGVSDFETFAARPEEAAALAAAVATLVRHGWHPLWCLVFDEAWTWLSRMRGVLAALVPGARPNCDFMAWYIDPVRCERGWVPHRDRRNMPVMPDDGAQEGVEYATVWLALTEATPLNSCAPDPLPPPPAADPPLTD